MSNALRPGSRTLPRQPQSSRHKQRSEKRPQKENGDSREAFQKQPGHESEDRMKPALSIFLLVLVLAQAAHAGSWGPWSTSQEAPVISLPADREPRQGNPDQSHSIAATPFLWLLTFYQKVVNRVINGRCPMYPTCSQYSVQAIRKHAPGKIFDYALLNDRPLSDHLKRNSRPHTRKA